MTTAQHIQSLRLEANRLQAAYDRACADVLPSALTLARDHTLNRQSPEEIVSEFMAFDAARNVAWQEFLDACTAVTDAKFDAAHPYKQAV